MLIWVLIAGEEMFGLLVPFFSFVIVSFEWHVHVVDLYGPVDG